MCATNQKISPRWWKMANMYRRFAGDYPQADFGHAAAWSMYNHESHGTKIPPSDALNGFALGKKWMDVTVAAWREDIQRGLLWVQELQEDGYPDWFLQRIGVLKL